MLFFLQMNNNLQFAEKLQNGWMKVEPDEPDFKVSYVVSSQQSVLK